ncbi:acetyl-CoA carboxylase carboxyl transferase subunit alpha [Paenibacillus chitinolyticus]|uniref:Acetyl-coenzyme A carboxylase carboxyl transferase subunit alpha n=1 Tax=Paenibacillus chitinolyticus TaxID=79263 RepID=A0A410WTS6_9BACL|nr:acetyl-CoA carboxylase carboxyl transferase subunit alpha [Paenibacillus chitinolyticus]MCY9589099.1 acetyl-CoA carboxylase carboxyl transferase subunit alpha [Paenibacillus chitinolyticus]MCY9598531.1 acetyl-CoA carboxylase carboxyl transferase subunit alpha [Paenibacillus chitinolyticus]QAV17734.1 acetyl-CoA carboxylase carboxyl transferase subunit alpha [Paenibacillus chitinolyticus]GKS09336.1 acetyl-coenzyme A carboxylase carboxyl transferase subunit alpha [Paenibacillus chitinolyticus]
MAGELSFEQPLTELRSKIDELKRFGEEKKIDFTDEIRRLEERYAELQQELYSTMSASEKMQLARHPQRPTTIDYIERIFTDFVELHGDRLYGDDLAIIGGVAKLDGLPVTVVGHQKGKDTKDNIARNFGSPHPEGFRKALRLMKQADKFGRPVITFIDTKGAFPGNAAEERGQGEAIARNLLVMAGLRVPVVCVVIGEGGSGGALALGVGNRVLMLENAIYSVISPEGAASILYNDASKSLQAAEAMKITAKDIAELGVIDSIVSEPQGGAHRDLELQSANIKAAVLEHMQPLLAMSEEELKEDRYLKFRQIGRYTFTQEGNHA